MKLRRSSRRLAWIGSVNGGLFCWLVTGGFTLPNLLMMTALLAGIGLELASSWWGAAFNIGAFLFAPVAWMCEVAHPYSRGRSFRRVWIHIVDFALPCTMVAGVNLMLYAVALKKAKQEWATDKHR
jgi:hypothetical protein